MTAVAKITAKDQTTIPQENRAALRVGPGDLIANELAENGPARVRRLDPVDLPYLRALEGMLSEWSGAADERTCHDLRSRKRSLA